MRSWPASACRRSTGTVAFERTVPRCPFSAIRNRDTMAEDKDDLPADLSRGAAIASTSFTTRSLRAVRAARRLCNEILASIRAAIENKTIREQLEHQWTCGEPPHPS